MASLSHPRHPSAFSPVLEAYELAVAGGSVRHDPRQAQCAALLDRVRADLLAAPAATPEPRRFFFLSARPKPKPAVRGLYIYGPVGRGKSMLTEMFLRTLPEGMWIRKHFHDFLRETHAALRRRREDPAVTDPMKAAALDVTQGKRLLCFDEFQVHDIADAMLLHRLFAALFAEGVVLVATSNAAPNDLYPDGLQREHILPFIAELNAKTEAFALVSETDYRRSKQEADGPERASFRLPSETERWRARLLAVAQGEPASERLEPLSGGRTLKAACVPGRLLSASFQALCMEALSAADYAAMLSRYDALAVYDAPLPGYAPPAAAARFVHLVDMVYEARALFLTGFEEPSPADPLPFNASPPPGMARCLSRLAEMRSSEYIALASLRRTTSAAPAQAA